MWVLWVKERGLCAPGHLRPVPGGTDSRVLAGYNGTIRAKGRYTAMNVQVNFRGGSSVISGQEFGISSTMSEEVIRNILCDIYEIPSSIFRDCVIDRNGAAIMVTTPGYRG
jgi:hypothetical protein